MKKIFMVSVLVLVLSVVVAPVFSEEMAKEGTGSGKGDYTGSYQLLPMAKERAQMNYEGFGVLVTDTGQGLFHNSSQHVLGGMHIVK